MRAFPTCKKGKEYRFEFSCNRFTIYFSPNNEEVKPVFSDKLFCYSSDEGFEGSPANLPSTPTRKIRYCWKSPTKPSSSVAPYLIEASPIRIQRKKKESQSSPKTQNIDTRCDFISQLAARNMDIIIQQIFGHCGNRELQKVKGQNVLCSSFFSGLRSKPTVAFLPDKGTIQFPPSYLSRRKVETRSQSKLQPRSSLAKLESTKTSILPKPSE